MIVNAPAKVNIGLRLLRKRPDGYHEIESFFHTLAWGDTLHLEAGEGIHLEVAETEDAPVRGITASVPDGPDNLAWKAAEAICEALGFPGVRILLQKRIPAGSGLGGGSSDAAAVLAGLPLLYGGEALPEVLHGLAAGIGADVPFFLKGGCALVEGIGERITPLEPLSGTPLVVALPAFGVSTAGAYAAANYVLTRSGAYREYLASVGGVDALVAGTLLKNDLQIPVTADYPQIHELVQSLAASGAVLASMTGSGSAVFGLFASQTEAAGAAIRLSELGVGVVRTQLA